MSDIPEPDRFSSYPHPRERHVLFGHGEAERAFLDAYRQGRLHHAWLLAGPEGIGKATLAYRMARFLLAHPDPQARAVVDASDLSVPADAPAARRVQAQAHSDFVVLRRRYDAEKKRVLSQIPVEDIRDAVGSMTSTSGEGGWRIAIVDSAEDLNPNSANALLKTLEEPPAKALFIIVSHAPGRLLPTIRSRCRRLAVRLLGHHDLMAVMTDLGATVDHTQDDVARAIERADGSARGALVALEPRITKFTDKVLDLIGRLPRYELAQVLDIADELRGSDGDELFEALLVTIRDWLAANLRGRAGEGAASLAPLADVWDNMARAVRELETYNLDRRPFVVGLVADLAEAVSRSRRV